MRIPENDLIIEAFFSLSPASTWLRFKFHLNIHELSFATVL